MVIFCIMSTYLMDLDGIWRLIWSRCLLRVPLFGWCVLVFDFKKHCDLTRDFSNFSDCCLMIFPDENSIGVFLKCFPEWSNTCSPIEHLETPFVGTPFCRKASWSAIFNLSSRLLNPHHDGPWKSLVSINKQIDLCFVYLHVHLGT